MKLKATLVAPRVDFSKYKQALNDVLAEAIARAAFEWLGATTTVVPTWSGASQATFSHLATGIGFSLSILPVAPSRIDLGLSSATGSITTDRERGQYQFEYSTTLSHLIVNEFRNVNAEFPQYFHLRNPGPYHFQEKGQKAFEQVAKDVRLPEPTFSLTSIRV